MSTSKETLKKNITLLRGTVSRLEQENLTLAERVTEAELASREARAAEEEAQRRLAEELNEGRAMVAEIEGGWAIMANVRRIHWIGEDGEYYRQTHRRQIWLDRESAEQALKDMGLNGRIEGRPRQRFTIQGAALRPPLEWHAVGTDVGLATPVEAPAQFAPVAAGGGFQAYWMPLPPTAEAARLEEHIVRAGGRVIQPPAEQINERDVQF